MKRSLSHTTTKRKDDKKQERKFEEKKKESKENQNYCVVVLLIVAFAIIPVQNIRYPTGVLRHEDAIMNKHYYN